MNKKRSVKDWLYVYLTGLTMGAADIVPGVSGGTMAFIMGLYSELIENIAKAGTSALRLLPKLEIKAFLQAVPWAFFLCLGAGIVTSLVSLAKVISYLLANQPAYVFSFFGGLILASAIAVCSIAKFSKSAWMAMLLFALFTAWLVGLNPMANVSHTPLVLFMAGMIAISAMILPGISGSFLLLLMGQYEFILEAVHQRDFLSIAAVGSGCAVGILLAVHVVNFFLHRFHAVTIAALVGIMIGSLRLIAAKVSEGFITAESMSAPPSIAIALILFAVGFIFVTTIDQMQSKNNLLFRWRRRAMA